MNIFEDYGYEIINGSEAAVARYLGYEEKVVIPDSMNGLPVKAIRKQAFATSDILEAEIPEGIESIEEEAFAVCESLERISLPASLNRLGKGVFKGCGKLREISLPNGSSRFAVDDGILYNTAEGALIICPPALEKEVVTVPTDVKTIACAAFYLNRKLKHVRLPLRLKTIESEAFLFTNAMQIIELPPYLERIEPGCFLVGRGPYAEKHFVIYAFPDTVGYRYAEENRIPVSPLYAIVTD